MSCIFLTWPSVLVLSQTSFWRKGKEWCLHYSALMALGSTAFPGVPGLPRSPSSCPYPLMPRPLPVMARRAAHCQTSQQPRSLLGVLRTLSLLHPTGKTWGTRLLPFPLSLLPGGEEKEPKRSSTPPPPPPSLFLKSTMCFRENASNTAIASRQASLRKDVAMH